MTQNLIAGFNAFRKRAYEGETPVMPELVEQGQDPDYFIISCIDSRTNPATIFGAPPGTFFAHKAMGAIIRPYRKGRALAAALQFALYHQNVTKIIILGHTNCGAVKALVEGLEDEEIQSFVTVAQQGLERAKELESCGDHHDDLFRHTEEQIVHLSKKNLLTYPSVQARLSAGKLEIRCWLFEMAHGHLLEYDERTGHFEPIDGAAAS